MSCVTIIICTYNRSESLRDTLDSFRKMVVPQGIKWEVLVVDNNSKDDTKHVVDNFIKKNNSITINYLFEPIQGKSHALNKGIQTANSEFIVFTDDDVVVDKDWLKIICETFIKFNADCVGGRIFPIWGAKRPDWLKDSLLNILAILDLGCECIEFKNGDNIMLYGANFAFRKKFFNDHGLFDTKLGPKGAFGRGEDEMIFKKLLSVNGKAMYNPDIVVYHKIPIERLVKSYFRKWCLHSSKSLAQLEYGKKNSIFMIPGYMLKDSAITFVKYLLSISLLRDDSFQYELKLISYFSFFKNRILQSLKVVN
jgi:glucosyl-dolichyl phosphate glucuronosyltransferase